METVEVVKEVEVIREVPVEKIVIREVIVEVPVAAEETAPAVVATEIEVRWNGLDPLSQEAALREAARFEDETGIAIRPGFTNWASSFQTITTGFAAGTVPDIWQAGGLWTPVLASRGGTLRLDGFVDEWDGWPDWYPVAREDVEYEGGVHGIPYRVHYRGNPVIRLSYFEGLGVEPTPPTTWEELDEAAQRLTIRDGTR